MGSIITLALFVGLFYLMLWLPQAKRAKAHRNLMSNLQKGDEIITSGGMLGKIAKVEDDFITLTIAPNVDIAIQKDSVAASVPKGTLK
ncbi:MAG TPA: preprotein translocase subunit YajC [Gammaproteobacteria bacterium]|nr:preprotein translocase subunit YajC [Gammaproteobacteria bacterium]